MLADVAEGAVRRRAEVDRRGPAAGGRGPAGAQELLAGRHQVVRPAPGALGVEDQHVRVHGQQVDQELHLVDQHRGERLHALGRDAGGDLVGQLHELRVTLTELLGAGPHVVGEQQLAARRRPQTLDLLVGALVGDREAADLLDVVAPELHAERVLLGRREHVDDAAADRELPALLDQVDPRVRRVGQAAYDVLERRRVAGCEVDRLEVAQPLDLRLEHRADGRDHDLQRAVHAGRARRDPGVGRAAAAPRADGRRCRCAG